MIVMVCTIKKIVCLKFFLTSTYKFPIKLRSATQSATPCIKCLLYSLFLVFTSEPSAPPLNVRGHNISSTSILVVWGEVPTAYRNGIITSYNITYYSQTENHSNSTRVDHPVRQVTLPGLKEFVNYSITVLASTVKGNGPKSDPIIVSTGEDGELFCFKFEVRRCISETRRLLIINIHLDSLKIE